MIDENDQVFYKSSITANLCQKPGGLKQIDFSGDLVCGVNALDQIFCKEGLDQTEWKNVPGSLKYISVNKGVLYGVNSNDDIFMKDYLKDADFRLINNAKLKQVQSSGNAVCGVTSNDQILCKDDL